jgi:AhpD family alkylhydroperoxidase
MATIGLIPEGQATGKVKAVYSEIKKTFGTIPSLFKAMAHQPEYLDASWQKLKVVMGPGKLDRKTKEMIAVAVSAANNCEYCVNAHTAALKQLGVTDPEIVELMAVVDLFSGLNKFLDGLRIEPDLKP